LEAFEVAIFKSWNLGSCLNKNSLALKVGRTRIQEHWTPPQEGFIKLNFDGTPKEILVRQEQEESLETTKEKFFSSTRPTWELQ
jgi:hypothetical protein